MNPTKLSKALRVHADTVEDTHTAELLRVFARLLEGKTLYQTFGAPGDWGYGTPIGDGVIDMLRRGDGDDRLGQPIEWHYLPELPDDETRVMFALGGETDEPGVGYKEGDIWFYDNNDAVDLARFPVYAWAHIPAKPAKKGGVS